MSYGSTKKRTYWAIVDVDLDIVANHETGRQLWSDYGDCVRWFYGQKFDESMFKIIKWTPMIKPENWK